MSSYTRDQIEWLLPGVWDSTQALGRRKEDAPEQDMPKAKPDPRRASDGAAALADIQRAWVLAPLSRDERRVLVLMFGLDFTQRQAAFQLDIPKGSIDGLKNQGVGRLRTFLNGTELNWEEEVA